MKPWRAPRRLAVVVLVTLATLLPGYPAQAETRVMPGPFTGYAFDTCQAPRQSYMDTWLDRSPFRGVGVYIAGINRHCDQQTYLNSDWVQTQSDNGWRILPLTVGLQASCNTRPKFQQPGHRISPDATDGYATARAQGRVEARGTVFEARALGIRAGSTLWFDLEHFAASRLRCRESALAFLSGWTWQLHRRGYGSGVYSSGSSGIRALDDARVLEPGRYNLPDQLWIADWNGVASVDSGYVRSDGWSHARVHQYRGGHNETYGGVRINIDRNYVDVGRGSFAPREPGHCGGVTLNFAQYRRLSLGDRGAQVKAAQCLLRVRRLYVGQLRFQYTPRTEQAVRAFQAKHALPVTGAMSLRTWTALLSGRNAPVLKIGSASHAVRRLQRALNAAVGAGLTVTGVFDVPTLKAVRSYQAARGLPRSGVVAAETWSELHAGRR